MLRQRCSIFRGAEVTCTKMVKEKKLKSGNRYGTRYGRKNRDRVAKLEQGHKGKQMSPFCNMRTVRRISAGIWHCMKTGKTFASRAYAIDKNSFKKGSQQ